MKIRKVLLNTRGVSLSLPELLVSTTVRLILLGGLLVTTATLLYLQVTANNSAQASSSAQASDLRFKAQVSAADIVRGQGTDTVALMRTDSGSCEVTVWRSEKTGSVSNLITERSTAADVCSAGTAVPAAGTGTKQMLMGTATVPTFSYKNVGGRTVVFDADGNSTLADTPKPSEVSVEDWDDVRPQRVELNIGSEKDKVTSTAKKTSIVGFTEILNFSQTEGDLNFVPGTEPLSRPVAIGPVSVVRSDQVGTAYVGKREGAAVSFSGGQCTNGLPSIVNVSWLPASPAGQATVDTTYTKVLTGQTETVHLAGVANGASGKAAVTSKCFTENPTTVTPESSEVSYTQPVPVTTLTVAQDPLPHSHTLNWVQVSSLPTTFDVRWQSPNGLLTPDSIARTPELTHTAVQEVGTTYGFTTGYTVVATVDGVDSRPGAGSIQNIWPTPDTTTVTSTGTGANWTAISCPPGTNPQYSARFHKQAGTSTAVNWQAASPWGTARSFATTTPDNGRTVTEASTRCASRVSESPAVTAGNMFYEPSPLTVSGVRSTTAGTTVGGVREGVNINYTGGQCYLSNSTVKLNWNPATPAGQTAQTQTVTARLDGTSKNVALAGAANGAVGQVTGSVSCVAAESGTKTGSAAFTQAVPKPTVTVAQGSLPHTHNLSWNKVSSLPTSFNVAWSSTNGRSAATAAKVTALSYTNSQVEGTTYGYTTTFTVTPTVGAVSGPGGSGNGSNAWPAIGAPTVTSSASGASWTAITCPAGTTPQYNGRYLQQWKGNDATAWTTAVNWANTRSFSKTTPDIGRTVTDVSARCASAVGTSPTGATGSDRFYQPGTIDVSANRSTSAGASYSGAREGIDFWYSGAECYKLGSVIGLEWRPATPSGLTGNSRGITRTTDGAPAMVTLTDVKNGSTGNILGSVTCDGVKSGTKNINKGFNQTVPQPTLTVSQGATAEKHDLTWTAVSSLPIRTVIEWASGNGRVSGVESESWGQQRTTTQQLGTTYGFQTQYWATSYAGAYSAKSSAKAISNAWPAAPQAKDITYTRDGRNGMYQAGHVDWSFTKSCPAGTNLFAESRDYFNHEIDADRAWSGWIQDNTSKSWGPGASMQGYRYGVAVEVFCKSPVTNSESAKVDKRGALFTTPMQQPAAPKWNAYNHITGTTGSKTDGRETCRYPGQGSTMCGPGVGRTDSLTLNMTTYCSAGATAPRLGTILKSNSWVAGSDFTSYFGDGDGWELPNGSAGLNVAYGPASYICETPWATSARSPNMPAFLYWVANNG